MIHLIIALALTCVGMAIVVWGFYNLLVEQHTYSGPTPISAIVAILFFIKAYKEYDHYRKKDKK